MLTAAAELLLDQRAPRADTRWHYVGSELYTLSLEAQATWRWYARQLAAQVSHGDEAARAELREHFQLSTSLQRPEVADLLFSWLAEALPEAFHFWLISASYSVSWDVKRAMCERLAPAIFGSTLAPEIGTPAWEAELLLLGVSEDETRALYEDVLAGRQPHEVFNLDVFSEPDPPWGKAGGRLASLLTHQGRPDKFRPREDSPERLALQTATLFYAFWRWPLHASLDFVRVCAWDPHRPPHAHSPLVRRWIARQIAACLRSAWSEGETLTQSEEHLLDQFFGFTDIDPILFPWLVTDLPAELHPALLTHSATVAWIGKRDFYARFARDPADHTRLADALARACKSGVFHSIDAREGLALVDRLHALEPQRADELRALLTGPLVATAVAVAEPAEPAFCTLHPGRSFIALTFETELLMWLMDADLWLDDQRLGPLATWAHGPWPEGPTTGREGLQRDGGAHAVAVNRRHDAPQAAPSDAARLTTWHTLDVPYERLLELVGRRVEFRPRLG